MTHDSGRQAGIEKTEEIEITPEMVESGAGEILAAIESTDAIGVGGPKELATSVYLAMRKMALAEAAQVD